MLSHISHPWHWWFITVGGLILLLLEKRKHIYYMSWWKQKLAWYSTDYNVIFYYSLYQTDSGRFLYTTKMRQTSTITGDLNGPEEDIKMGKNIWPHLDNFLFSKRDQIIVNCTKKVVTSFLWTKKQYRNALLITLNHAKTVCTPGYFHTFGANFVNSDFFWIFQVFILSSYLFCRVFLGHLSKPIFRHYQIYFDTF